MNITEYRILKYGWIYKLQYVSITKESIIILEDSGIQGLSEQDIKDHLLDMLAAVNKQLLEIEHE